ncbi:hypothetical protein [Alkalimarinus alittae]|uniref:Uncharacterized protein n=1 Tax=Alkalimarinus alittae TaxID=2961619 RepID=A0ABY6N417_9ALTE|nr:hypothetical protein [Alkalimarinus alittae]UZE96867.1 hypothetical protein NKI27_03710 [Alkalimarinus alittae]
MKFILGALLSLITLYGCSTVKIIDANPDNPAKILKSEMSGLSPSQTNTQGSWQSTLDYVNKKLKYGEKVFYSTTFKKFVHAKFSNEYTLFEMSALDIDNAYLRRQGIGSKKGNANNSISIPAKNQSKGFEHILASGERSTSHQLVLKVDSASDSIKVKQAFKLMSPPAKQGNEQE